MNTKMEFLSKNGVEIVPVHFYEGTKPGESYYISFFRPDGKTEDELAIETKSFETAGAAIDYAYDFLKGERA